MANFPTLSRNPSVSGWTEGVAIDPTVKSTFEGGYVQTYPAFTREVYGWNVSYFAISQTEKDAIRSFEQSVRVGAGAFNWVNPINNQIYTVRFAAPIQYKLHGNTQLWDVSFRLEQV